jgi:hypothetical protein
LFVLALIVWAFSHGAQAQVTSWNAFDDFYVNVPATNGGGNFTQTDWINNAEKISFDTG